MVQIVIPAAGIGSRLKEINPFLYPKLLVEICGKTFLDRLNYSLSPIKDKEFIFVLGSKYNLLKDAIDNTIKSKTTFLYNQKYKETNCGSSLAKALPLITGNWIYINSDLIFEKLISIKLKNNFGKNKICVNFGKQTDLHKFTLKDNTYIKDWYPVDFGQTTQKELDCRPKLDGEIVGPILANKKLASDLLDNFKSLNYSKQNKISCYTLFSLINNGQFSTIDITENLWQEVDTVEDFRIAENLIHENNVLNNF